MNQSINSASKYYMQLVLLAVCMWSVNSIAQIPIGYYDAAQGKSGVDLKATLNTIISGHTTYPYSSTATDVWDILKDADKDPNNPANVIGIYSGFSMDAAAEYAGGAGWNREHVWAKSRGDFGTTEGAGTDCHHIVAEDVSTNSARNNRNFGYGETYYTDVTGTYNGPTLSKTSSTEWTWEPRDSKKGDVARMIFYMATRYEGVGGEPDLELTETLMTNTDKSPFHAKLSVLLEWHQNDPVSAEEQNRNEVIYSYQNNRNPFIDHPEYVCLIYSCSGGGSNLAPQFSSTPVTTVEEGSTYSYAISTTDAEGDTRTISATTLPLWLSLTDNGDGTAMLTGIPTSGDVGNHNVTLNVFDGTGSSNQNFTINVTAIGGGGGNGVATDLFISEYIEGSSYNKGIEIANFTGEAVNLSNYSLFKQTNGAGAWGSELALSGTLANGEVFVIVHSSSDAAMQSQANLVTSVAFISFNGNDPVALFKNAEIIDVVGTFNSTANYAKDVTIVRNPTVDSPSTLFNISEWTSYANNTFTYFGSHTFNGGITSPDTTAPVITLVGSTSISLNVGDTYIEQGATATDNIDGDLTSSIVITGTVNTAVAGTYTVNYNVSDAAGNAASQVSRTVIILADTTAPVITLVGSTTINLNVGDTYIEQGATATDNIDGDLTSSIVITGTVNTAVAGTYTVNYNVSDAAGNAASQVSRTVIILADTTAPVITLVGSTSISLNVGDTYIEQGATATDNIDGDLTSSIVITGTVNTAVAGTYTVNYNVSDAAGNAASQVSRTVNVNEVVSGCTGGIVSFPYSEGFESGLGLWLQASGDDLDWTRAAYGTKSSGTGPSSATEGLYYMYVEASSPNYPSKTTILNSPCVDLTAETGATFSFAYHMYGSNMGSLTLEASTDGTNWVLLWTMSGDQGNSWSTANADLGTYAGGTVQLRFVGVTGDKFRSDMAIDNISITTGTTGGCSDVTLSLTVDNFPEETSWNITDAGGVTVASGGTYGSIPDGSTVIETSCLADGCYTFTINDAYGDGICCTYGNGSYVVTDALGTTIASGGSFTSSQATNFCVSSGAATIGRMEGIPNRHNLNSSSLLYPNPVSNYLNINIPKGMESMNVYATNGVIIRNVQIYENGIDVSQLKVGVYMVIIKTEKGVIQKKFIKE